MYNSVRSILTTINSVINQTYSFWELIVVDDGSTDNSLDLVKSINDERIIVISQKNAGVSSARNTGVAKARSDLVALLDSDDEWLPEFLNTIIKLVRLFPDCGLYATSYLLQYPDTLTPKPIKLSIKIQENHYCIIKDYFQITIEGNPIFNASSVAVRKKVFEKIGGFPENIKGGEDLLTWAKFALFSDIAYSSIPLAIYHLPAINSRNIRTLPDEDPVGCELLQISEEYKFSPKASYLQKYIAHWYKIRASTYLSKGYRSAGKKYTALAIQYSGLTPKLSLYYAISLIPAPFSASFFRFFLSLMNSLRILNIKIKQVLLYRKSQ